MSTKTPWGKSQHSAVIMNGITEHSTAGHGGIHLSAERNKQLQAKFRFDTFAGGPWYEEDCDVAAVVIAFPTCFKTQSVIRAIEAATAFKGWEERDGVQGKWHRVAEYCKNQPTLINLMADKKNVLAVMAAG